MRKLLFVILICTVFTGCKDYQDTYVVNNKTDKNIQIEGFAVKWSKLTNRSPIYNELIEIQPNSKYIIKKGKGESWEPHGIFKVEDIDSVLIIFNNERLISYSCNSINGVNLCNDTRNILFYQKYYENNCGEHECTYIYTITDEDYDSAVKIK